MADVDVYGGQGMPRQLSKGFETKPLNSSDSCSKLALNGRPGFQLVLRFSTGVKPERSHRTAKEDVSISSFKWSKTEHA